MIDYRMPYKECFEFLVEIFYIYNIHISMCEELDKLVEIEDL